MRLSLFLISMVILLFFCSLLTGHTQASVITSLKALISGEGPLGTVMQEIRLPRAILAVLIGGSLGLCGAAMQGYLRNPSSRTWPYRNFWVSCTRSSTIITNGFCCCFLVGVTSVSFRDVFFCCTLNYVTRW